MLEYKYEYFRLKDKVIFEGKIKEGKNYEGKEFDKNGKLIFQGEYKKCKKWYQESEPFYGNVILLYEKEYYNFKRWNGTFYNPENNSISGKIFYGNGTNIKEFNKEGKLIFEGEYKEGVKYKGKEYNNSGELIFEGEF